MTVSLLIEDASIENENERFDRSKCIPVATSDYFRGYWMPGAKALELRYVPQFYDPGIPLSQEDLPDVLLELAALKTWMSKNFPNGQDAGTLQRIDTVTDALRRCVGCDNLKICIG
jgi:hypothetical protein